MRSDIYSNATQMRMIRLYLHLSRMDRDWQGTRLTSEELAGIVDATPATIRKDLSRLDCHASGWGYQVDKLTDSLKEALSLSSPVKTGISGLETWGTILLNKQELLPGVEVLAGFDSSMNRLERTNSPVPLYPTYEIPEIFRRNKLLLGIISSEGERPQQTADRMISGGAVAILNLTSRSVKVPKGKFVYQSDFQSGILKLLSHINRSLLEKEES